LNLSLQNRTEFANRTASGAAADAGANKSFFLFHLSEKKKRHNPLKDMRSESLAAALHQSDHFGSLTGARQIRSRNIQGDQFDPHRLRLHQH
jgi:hypothetical protein